MKKTIFFRDPVLGMTEYSDKGENIYVRDQQVKFTINEIDFIVPLSNVLFITQDYV